MSNDNMTRCYDATGNFVYYTSKWHKNSIFIKCSELTLDELDTEICRAIAFPGATTRDCRISAHMENTGGCSCHPEPCDFETFLEISK